MSELKPAFYLQGRTIHKAPRQISEENAMRRIVCGFPVCTVSEYCDAGTVMAILEQNESSTTENRAKREVDVERHKETMRAPLRYDAKFGAIYDVDDKEIACPIGAEGAALVGAFNTQCSEAVELVRDMHHSLQAYIRFINASFSHDKVAMMYAKDKNLRALSEAKAKAEQWLEKVRA